MKKRGYIIVLVIVGLVLSVIGCGKPDAKDALIDYYVKTIEFSKSSEFQKLKSDDFHVKNRMIEKSEEIAKSCGFLSLAHLASASQEYSKDPEVVKLKEEYKRIQKKPEMKSELQTEKF